MTDGSPPATVDARSATTLARDTGALDEGSMYRLLVQSVRDYAIFMLDVEGRVASWNEGAQRIKGYAADQILGRHFSTFYPQAALDAGLPAHELEVAARVGRFEDEGWRLRRDGSAFWANVVITAVRDDTGRLVGFAKVTRDLTARREAEEQARRLAAEQAAHAEAERRGAELEQLNDQLQQQAVELEMQTNEAQALAEELREINDELQAALAIADAARADAERSATQAAEANRVKSEFLATMSHELRTPLNAIAGYAELLQLGVHGPVTEAQRHAIARIQRSQRHLLGLINDVLNFAKLQAGRVTVQLATVPVRELLAQIDDLMAPQLRAKGLAYAVDGADAALAVRADREKATQILVNLLSNAIKFTPAEGRIDVGIAARANVIAIEVRDSGIGIPADRLEAVFEPFVQVASTLSSRHEGTGLGLAISRDLARLMNGDLTVRSAPDEGSAFTLTLPRARDRG